MFGKKELCFPKRNFTTLQTLPTVRIINVAVKSKLRYNQHTDNYLKLSSDYRFPVLM